MGILTVSFRIAKSTRLVRARDVFKHTLVIRSSEHQTALRMSSTAKTPSVEYTWLGPNCGIKVSNICLGTMTFGKAAERFKLPGNTNEEESHKILDRFFELGGNFIDTANIYTNGESEEIIGSWLAKHDRSQIVIATKVRFTNTFLDEGPNDIGLSRGSIMNNVEKSLKRLKTDYIDLYYSHCWDAGVKLEETLHAFNDLVRSGKVRYVGFSNLTGAQLQKIVDYNKFLGFNLPVVLQSEYNLLERNSDVEVVPTLRTEGVALVPYGALKGGLLSGKFKRDDQEVVKTLAGTRLAWTAEKPAERTLGVAPHVEQYRNNEEYWKLMDAMAAIGKEHGKTQSQVATRWLIQKDFVSSVIIGAKSIAQLEENMGAGAGWKLTDEQVQQLDDLSFRPPVTYPYTFVQRVNGNRTRP